MISRGLFIFIYTRSISFLNLSAQAKNMKSTSEANSPLDRLSKHISVIQKCQKSGV